MLLKQKNWLAFILLAVLLLVASIYATMFIANRISGGEAIATNPLSDITIIDVIINDTFYGEEDTNIINPPFWRVSAGTDVLIRFENRGTLTHNWAVVKQGAQVPIPFEEGQSSEALLYHPGMVYGENQSTATFTAPLEPGEYQVICTVVGHYPTMQGILITE